MTYETKLSRSLRLIFSGSAAVGFAMLAQPVFAQVAPTPDTSSAEPVQAVVITGSMIKRVDAETAEAVTVIKAETLKDMGITSVEQALALVSTNNQTLTTASNVSTFAGGASEASLRGLGATKTLVLLDGQRLANNVATGSGVDLNTIPFAAIDHIEILQEGASSLYGSDAIAGVINFITKKDLEGGSLNVQALAPQSSGGASSSADFAYGHGNLADDGYNIMATLSLTKQNELTASQRSFASTGYYPAQGLQNLNGPTGPAPGSFTDNSGTATTPGNLWQSNYPGCSGIKNVVPVAGSCEFLYSSAVDLIPKSTSESGMIQFSKRLANNNTLTLQYFYSHFDLQTWGGPQEYGFAVPTTSPYYPGSAASPLSQFSCVGTCSTTSPVLGQPVIAGWTDTNNNRYFGNVNTEQRFLATLSGENLGWDYSTSFNWSQNKGVQQVRGGEADYSILAPGGNLSPLINPFAAQQSAAGQALINSAYMNGNLEVGTLSLMSLNGHASHDLGDAFAAGRPAQIAVGFDIRNEKISNEPTALASTLYTATYFPPEVVSGGRHSDGIYSELFVPVTKKLDFTISDRFDQFSDFGETNNAKVSFSYKPADMVMFRGAASTGFRAPTLVEEYSPQTFGAVFGTMNGPGCASGNYNAVFSQLNCSSQGLSLGGGNPQLKPETSQNFDLGMVLSPAKNLDFTADYYRINLKNEIQTIPASTIYGSPTTFASSYVLNSAGTLTPAPVANIQCPTPTASTCGYILTNLQNTGGITTDGIDLSANYVINSAFGKFRLGANGTYVMDYKLQEYPGGPQLNLVGQFNGGNQPVIRFQDVLTLDWTQGKFGAGLNNHFMSKYQDYQPDAAGNEINVASYSIWNGYVSFKPMTGLKLLVGVNNLFNQNPPFSNQEQNWQAGYNPLFSSALGRAYNLRLTYDF